MQWLCPKLYNIMTEDSKKAKQLRMVGGISICLVLISSIIYKTHRNKTRQDKNTEMDIYFSHSYEEAKTKFVNATSFIKNAKLHEISIGDPNDNLSIHLCYIPSTNNSNKHLLFHISGTHGVEAFAGSAIQIDLLKNVLNDSIQNNKNNNPHILFIHSLNPFGMKYNRRCNQQNIDLNRNCLLTQSEWTDVLNWSPNKFGYSDVNNFFNPQRKPKWYDDYLAYFQFIPFFISNGFHKSIKKMSRICASSQYVKQNGLYYGGTKLAIEHEKLISFLKNDCKNIFDIDLLNEIEKLTLIDIHSGLSNKGKDTILCKEEDVYEKINRLYPEYAKDNKRILCLSSKEGFYSYMFQFAKGFIIEYNGYPSLFKNVEKTNLISFAQEIDTLCSSAQILTVLRHENMAYNYCEAVNDEDNKILLKRGMDCRAVYYREFDPYWKYKTLQQGRYTFVNALKQNVQL
eukprot:480827_1